MRIGSIAAICIALTLAGCGSAAYQEDTAAEAAADAAADAEAAADAAPENAFGFYEAVSPSPFGNSGNGAEFAAETALLDAQIANDGAPGPAAQTPPRDGAEIAYSYSYGFRVDAEQVGELQQRHTGLCDRMGTRRCRVLSLSRAGSDGEGYGRLKLRVAASEARSFGDALDKEADEVGGEQVSFGLDGEDLTESIIDTEARLASRRVLRERLMEVLRTRQGSVADLVAAERAVAEANQEIDAAASQLAELRNRVRMSAVSIEYGPDIAVSSLGFTRPISTAFSSIGATLGVTIAAIIYIAVALVPTIAFLLLLRWLWRRSGLRLRRERLKSTEE